MFGFSLWGRNVIAARLGANRSKATSCGSPRSTSRSAAQRCDRDDLGGAGRSGAMTPNAAATATEGRGCSLRRATQALPDAAGQLRAPLKTTVQADSKLDPGDFVSETAESLGRRRQPRPARPAASRALRPEIASQADLQAGLEPLGPGLQLEAAQPGPAERRRRPPKQSPRRSS